MFKSISMFQKTTKRTFPLKASIMAVSIAVAMTGCSTVSNFFKADEHPPAKLVKLEQPISVANPVFKSSLSNRSQLSVANNLAVGLADNQLVAAGSKGEVASYNLNGQRLWSLDVNDDIVGGVSFDATSQTAIVTTRSAKVIALNSSTGQIKWQTQLAGTVLAPALIHNNRVVVSSNNGEIIGLSLSVGEVIWQFSTQTPVVSIRGSAEPTLLDNETVLIASADGRLHTLDIESGIPKWSRRVGVPTGASEVQRMSDIDGAPVVDGSQLYTVSYSGQLIGVDLESRQILFLIEAASKNRLALTANAVVVTTLEGSVEAYNRQTGELLWKNEDLSYRTLSNPVAAGNYIAVGDMDGVIHFLSPMDGRIVSRLNAKGAVDYLQVKDNYLFTETKSGQVAVWQLLP